MPGMVAFGRRWLIGSDDTIFIGICNVFLYFPWIIWSILEIYNWFFSEGRNVCDSALSLDVALTVFFSCFAMNLLIGVGFICFSTRGTIFQVEARTPCVMLFQIKAILNFITPLSLALVSYVLYKGDFCDNNSMKQTFLVMTVAQSFFTLVQLLFWWLVFDDEGSLSENKTKKKKKKKKTAEANFFLGSIPRSAVNKWKFRILALFAWCTYPSKGKRDAIKTVSEILAYISQELDIVLTDFFTGVILMRQKHLRYYREEELKMDSSPAITLPDGTPVDCFPTTDMPQWMNLHLARRYMHIGLGVFGWRWTMYRNVACGLCRLWNHLVCCFPCRKESVVEGDNCCGCNVAGLQLNSDVPYKDLIHVSFRNKVYVLPFFVAIDAHTSSVVISVRGTMSFNDILTDLAAGFEPMENAGCPQDVFCHAGMLKAALRIRDRLEDRGILKAAFEGRDGYHLITTGHSLGASVATLLALLLRPSHPSIRCFAFEPPPCISANALETTFDFVFSVVFGNDVVPYLSFGNIELMIQEVVKCVQECNLPKYKVLLFPLPKRDDDLTLEEDDIRERILNSSKKDSSQRVQLEDNSNTEVENQMKLEENGNAEVENHVNQEEKENTREEVSETVERTKNNVKDKTSLNKQKKTDLYIPGRVLHVRYSKNGYRLQIRTAQDFHPLMIRPGMVINHFPQYVEGCLEQLGHTYTLLSVSS